MIRRFGVESPASFCYTARKLGSETRCHLVPRPRRSGQGDENHFLPGKLLRRMRERDQAPIQLGATLFLRRMPGADGSPELLQTAGRVAGVRDAGGLRVEPEPAVESEPSAQSVRVGARRDGDAKPRAGARAGRTCLVRSADEEGNSLQTTRPARTTLRAASWDGVVAGTEGG